MTKTQANGKDQAEFPYRFQRTDLWRPAYDFLESLEKDTLVTQKEVSDWLDANPGILERLSEKHSRYHLVHYTQRMHLKMLKKRGKIPKVFFSYVIIAAYVDSFDAWHVQSVQYTVELFQRLLSKFYLHWSNISINISNLKLLKTKGFI